MKQKIDSTEQQDFFQSVEWSSLTNHTIGRPIHYLGSKLRIIDSIVKTVDLIDPSHGPVCDLFAGSGTVSRALSETRDVVASDIQEYSRVICSALLKPANPDQSTIDKISESICSSSVATSIAWATEPIKEYEDYCLARADNGDLEPLCDLLEYGSLVLYEKKSIDTQNTRLLSALEETTNRMHSCDLVTSPNAMITRYFGGIYFSFSQANQIDTIRYEIDKLPPQEKDTFVAALLSTSSEVVNTIGKQFAQPLRPRNSKGQPKVNIVQKVYQDRFKNVIDIYQKWLKRYCSIPKTERHHEILCKDYLETLRSLRGRVSIIYADPPYTRDHYSRYYHVLETICLRDNPEISTVRIGNTVKFSRGIYRIDRHQSDFCIKSKAPSAFESLFVNVKALRVPLVLSYSPYKENSNARPRLMTIGKIEHLAKQYFREVNILKAGNIAHQKLTKSELLNGISYEAEIFFTCIP